jgi:hypothetical protein
MYGESHPILRFQTTVLLRNVKRNIIGQLRREKGQAGLTGQVTRRFAAHSGPARSRFPQASGLRPHSTTMASMSEEDQKRIETVSQFLLQSPPGEINDVLNGTVDCVFNARIALCLIPPVSA